MAGNVATGQHPWLTGFSILDNIPDHFPAILHQFLRQHTGIRFIFLPYGLYDECITVQAFLDEIRTFIVTEKRYRNA
ncbi:hypothetical protein RAA17_15830 [Komagataeibacter rhaeticus]|nr:hypothetical protein [Komagataeibacter rhaeticus]